MLVRTRTDGNLCDVDTWTCTGSITRFVWAGDQILWELRAPGNGGTDANLEATTGGGNAYGRVSYSYAGGIDRPLVITKEAVATVIPHQNWRGMFANATTTTGALSQVPVDWPGFQTTPWHEPRSSVQNWFGSVATGMRDASGQIYMRNRYYNPATGQFTQPDPIGLAGGLNSYGFAAGDPVSYSDPYGLKVCYKGTAAEVNRLRAATEEATGAAVHLDKKTNCISSVGNSLSSNLRGLRNRLDWLRSRDEEYQVGYTFSSEFRGSGCDNSGSHFCPEDLVVEIDPRDIRRRTDPAKYFGCYMVGLFGAGPTVSHSDATVIAHELLGHAWAHAAKLGSRRESVAIGAENNYRRAVGGRQRCGG